MGFVFSCRWPVSPVSAVIAQEKREKTVRPGYRVPAKMLGNCLNNPIPLMLNIPLQVWSHICPNPFLNHCVLGGVEYWGKRIGWYFHLF